MEQQLNSKELGKRISGFRKAKGMSQEDLASLIGLPRTALTHIENANRELTAIELLKLSQTLQFSIDDFLSEDFSIEKVELPAYQTENVKAGERISVPILMTDKFRNVLLYILERCAGKPNVGETVLYKLLYFCDFNYYEIYEEHLTGARYRKMNYGPVPQKMNTIVDKMIGAGEIQKVRSEYYGKPQTRYLPLKKPDLKKFSAAEKEVIDGIIDQMSDWSAKMISDYSHNDKPWRATEVNGYIDYELAFYRRPPYSVRVYEEDEQNNI